MAAEHGERAACLAIRLARCRLTAAGTATGYGMPPGYGLRHPATAPHPATVRHRRATGRHRPATGRHRPATGPPPGYGAPPGYGPPQWFRGAVKPGIIPLRPLTLSDIFNGAVGYVRANPKATLGLTAIVVVVMHIITLVATLGPLAAYGRFKHRSLERV